MYSRGFAFSFLCRSISSKTKHFCGFSPSFLLMSLQYENGGPQETQESMKRSHNRLLIYLKYITADVLPRWLQSPNSTSLLFTVGTQGQAGRPCWSDLRRLASATGQRLCTRAHLEHVTERGFFWAQIRRKPVSGPRD